MTSITSYFFFLCGLFLLSSCSSFVHESSALHLKNMTVIGNSMYPTLKQRDVVVVDQDYYNTHALQRGDIVGIVLRTQRAPFVKRVVGIAGDVIDIKNHTVYVNGLPESPYYEGQVMAVDDNDYRMLRIQLHRYNNTIPIHSFLGLGDNRLSSLDSSFLGLFSYGQLYGKIVRS